MNKAAYYFDDNTGAIVKMFDGNKTAVMRPNTVEWVVLQPDNSYMREIFLGQGNR